MNTAAKPSDLARLALDVYRAADKLQAALIRRYLHEFCDIDEEEQRARSQCDELPF